jgi:hypothetical protein
MLSLEARGCVLMVHRMCKLREQFQDLYTMFLKTVRRVYRLGGFTSSCAVVLHTITHRLFSVFVSIRRAFMPAFHKTYKSNYKDISLLLINC